MQSPVGLSGKCICKAALQIKTGCRRFTRLEDLKDLYLSYKTALFKNNIEKYIASLLKHRNDFF